MNLIFITITFWIFCATVLFILQRFLSKRRYVFMVALFFALYISLAIYITVLGRIGTTPRFDIRLQLFWSYAGLIKANYPVFNKNFIDSILNILLFIPLGYLLPFFNNKLVDKCWKILLIGFLLTLSIELTQLWYKLGCFDVDDLFSNLLGTLVGWMGYLIIQKIYFLIFSKPKNQIS